MSRIRLSFADKRVLFLFANLIGPDAFSLKTADKSFVHRFFFPIAIIYIRASICTQRTKNLGPPSKKNYA